MHCVRVQHYHGILRDEFALITEVFRCGVWSSQPERVSSTLDFFDNGVNKGKAFLVLEGWKSVPSDHSIELFVSFLLDFRISWDQCQEPLHDRSRLSDVSQQVLALISTLTVSTPPIINAEARMASSR